MPVLNPFIRSNFPTITGVDDKTRDYLTSLQAVARSVEVPAHMAERAFGFESLRDDNQITELGRCTSALIAGVEGLNDALGYDKKKGEGHTSAQVLAGMYAGLMSGNWEHSLKAAGKKAASIPQGYQGIVVGTEGITDALGDRSFGMESYMEQENRASALYTLAFNYSGARQSEIGEANFPTITMDPTLAGFTVMANTMNVYDGIRRKATGDFQSFGFRNLIRAVADPTILKKNATLMIPVYRQQSAHHFSSKIPSREIINEGEKILTAPLKFGSQIDYMALCQTEADLAAGTPDQTDAMDPTVNLEFVYAIVGQDKLRIDVRNLPYTSFVFNPQDNARKSVLNLVTESLVIDKELKQLDGSDLVTLKPMVDAGLSVRLELRVTGDVSTEQGELNAFGVRMQVKSVIGPDRKQIPLNQAPAKAIVDAIAACELDSYEIYARKANSNRRLHGQFINVQKFAQIYNVPVLSPITAQHPINTDTQIDASDIQTLISTIRTRAENDAVDKLFQVRDMLAAYKPVPDANGVLPETMGVGRFYVLPKFMHDTVDIKTDLQTQNSSAQAADIQALIVNRIRNVVYKIYQDSEFKAAADMLAGGIAPVPTVVLSTDITTARWLQIDGDLRTLGGEFNVRVVTTLNERLRDQIAITFSFFDDSRNTSINPLSFGNFFWAPEQVLTANLSRNGQTSKETVVQPRYLFVNHCPVMGWITTMNLPETVGTRIPTTVNVASMPEAVTP